MMKSGRIAAAAFFGAAISLATPSVSFAQAKGGSPFYIGASIGQSKAKKFCDELAGASCDDKDTAWRILGGYQFHPNFAAEIGYHDFGKVTASGGGGSAR